MDNKFNRLVDSLISYNKDLRDSLPHTHYTALSNVSFTREFCTIRCNVGRRVGKSSYIERRAGINDLVIVPNQNLKKSGLATIITASEVKRIPKTYRGRIRPKYVNIYVDEPRMCADYLSIEEMYDILVCSKLQTFILLGE